MLVEGGLSTPTNRQPHNLFGPLRVGSPPRWATPNENNPTWGSTGFKSPSPAWAGIFKPKGDSPSNRRATNSTLQTDSSEPCSVMLAPRLELSVSRLIWTSACWMLAGDPESSVVGHPN